MSDKKATIKQAAASATQKSDTQSFAFGKENYVLMGIGLVIIILGFYLKVFLFYEFT